MNVPALRFKQDDGRDFPEWENTTLGEVAEIKRGAASQHLKYVEDEINGIRLIRINDFLKNEPVYIEATEDIKRFRLQRNDLLIAGTGATAGIVFRVPDDFDNLAYSYNAPRIRVSKANDGFIYYYLISDIVLKQQQGLFVGNAQPFLDTDAIRGFQIGLPSKQEQTKIANFLTVVDEKITQLTQKHDLLTQYKKGVMQQIFSQELRFKDDDGRDFPNWETDSLGSLFTIKAGGDIARENVSETKNEVYKYPVFANADKNLGLYGFSDKYKIDEEAITVTGRGNLGVAVPRYEPFYPIVRLLSLIPKNKFNIYFGATQINNINFHSESTGVPQLTAPQLANYVLTYPSIPEQTKIANFLTAIDDKITATQTQLKAVKQYKQGLLQQMFV